MQVTVIKDKSHTHHQEISHDDWVMVLSRFVKQNLIDEIDGFEWVDIFGYK